MVLDEHRPAGGVFNYYAWAMAFDLFTHVAVPTHTDKFASEFARAVRGGS